MIRGPWIVRIGDESVGCIGFVESGLTWNFWDEETGTELTGRATFLLDEAERGRLEWVVIPPAVVPIDPDDPDHAFAFAECVVEQPLGHGERARVVPSESIRADIPKKATVY